MIDKFVGLNNLGAAVYTATRADKSFCYSLDRKTQEKKRTNMQDKKNSPNRDYADAMIAELDTGIAASKAFEETPYSSKVKAMVQAGEQVLADDAKAEALASPMIRRAVEAGVKGPRL